MKKAKLKLSSMPITTKKGDAGSTSLLGGRRISKHDPRVEANGTLDELCSFLGLAKSFSKERSAKVILARIQKDVYTICAELAAGKKYAHTLKERICLQSIEWLETQLQVFEHSRRLRNSCFYLPGKTTLAGCFDVARTVARRAERDVVALKEKGFAFNRAIIVYLNRLSDLLYLLARSYEARASGERAGKVKGKKK